MPPGPNPELADGKTEGMVRVWSSHAVCSRAERRVRAAGRAPCALLRARFLTHSPPPQTQEDRDLKERLDLAVERTSDILPEIQRNAIEVLRKEIRESTR